MVDTDRLMQVLRDGVPNQLQIEYYALQLRLLDSQGGKTAQDEASSVALLAFVDWAKAHPAEFIFMGMLGGANADLNDYVIKAKLLIDKGAA